jgi:adenosine deaminase
MSTIAPALARLIRVIPKVELHIHIEGSLEPEMVFALAARHGVTLPFPSVEALRAAYEFDDLQSFLDLYYAGCDVLRTEDDFHAMTAAYLERAAADGVAHAEIFFDPQTHTARGVPMDVIIGGIRRALAEAETRHGLTSALILCFLRHLSEDDALATLEAAAPFRDELVGVGLDSGERGNPPAKFERVFARARAMGLRAVAHAGEEGPAAYIVEALDRLRVERVDHGVRCDEDDALVARLAQARIPLTVCPLSNVKLRVFDTMAEHNLARLLARGVCVTVNSDDPAYFGGYMNANFEAVCAALPIGAAEVVQLCRNAVEASFASAARKAELMAAIDQAAAAAAGAA